MSVWHFVLGMVLGMIVLLILSAICIRNDVVIPRTEYLHLQEMRENENISGIEEEESLVFRAKAKTNEIQNHG